MSLGETILLALSRDPESFDYTDAVDRTTVATALDGLRGAFPDLNLLIANAAVVDFGCGAGWQSIALAHSGAARVVGVDNNPRTLAAAQTLAAGEQVDDRVSFVPALNEESHGAFDVVISQNAFEHFEDPVGILRTMTAALRPGGRILIMFGPPWYAPTGSHMHFFTRMPWVNLLFPESTVMHVRSRYRADGATRYEEVESGLNRMTVVRFERIVRSCGLMTERREYSCVKKIRILQYLPLLRELFINNVACVLRKPGSSSMVGSDREVTVATTV